MHIQSIEDQQLWTDFLIGLEKNTFLQSTSWINFNRSYGYKTWTLGLFKEDKLVSTAFIFKLEAKRGHFLFCPHGPQVEELTAEILEAWTKYFKQLAKEEHCAFARISPIDEDTQFNRQTFRRAGFIQAPMHMHAELTTVMDISGTEEEVRARIKKNARYDLRKAEEFLKQGELNLETAQSITPEMYQVYQETFVRGAFVPFSREYLQAELSAFQCSGSCELILIRQSGKLISWGLVIFFGKRAFYHQGANVLVKGVPAPTLLQWTAIQKARELGCISYDFWGVAPVDNPKHPWTGISKFKRSFGGQDVAHMPAQDLVVSHLKYWSTWLIETFRRKKRGF